MRLNVFTHPIETPTIGRCLDSFYKVFGELDVTIWEDGINSNGLADGYIRAVNGSTDDYIFMLEHDWEFVSEIEQDLNEISEMMRRDGLTHLRFNKRSNEPKLYDKWLKDRGWYCETPFVSNNPHIIDRKAYLDYIDRGYIKRLGGKFGVEEIISKHINGAVYGGLGHPQIVRHIG